MDTRQGVSLTLLRIIYLVPWRLYLTISTSQHVSLAGSFAPKIINNQAKLVHLDYGRQVGVGCREGERERVKGGGPAGEYSLSYKLLALQ